VLLLTLALVVAATICAVLLRESQAVAVVAPTFSAIASLDRESPGATSDGAPRLSSTTSVSAPPSSSTTSTSEVPPSTSATTAVSTTTVTIYTHAISRPVRVVIPSVDIDAALIEVGLREEGVAEVPPFGKAAWYELGPAPGANGPAVLLGHVDSKKGPDVFYRLKDVVRGDTVLVYGEDGDVATFNVDAKEQVLKTDLPAGRIWNGSQQPLIRLITCGGEFDRSTGHYLSNLIVYGHLVR
jgi:sortase (surface protein transpeptidase)